MVRELVVFNFAVQAMLAGVSAACCRQVGFKACVFFWISREIVLFRGAVQAVQAAHGDDLCWLLYSGSSAKPRSQCRYAGRGSRCPSHCDNELLFGLPSEPKVIVSMSLGYSVLFKLLRRNSLDAPSEVVSEHGDLLVMDGLTQAKFEHSAASELQLDASAHHVLSLGRGNWLCSTFACARFSRTTPPRCGTKEWKISTFWLVVPLFAIGQARVGVVGLHGALLTLTTLATPAFAEFLRLERAIGVILPLDFGRDTHIFVLSEYQGAEEGTEMLSSRLPSVCVQPTYVAQGNWLFRLLILVPTPGHLLRG